MKVYFYLSPNYWLSPIPTLANFYDQASNGAHVWIIQTYLRLKKQNIACELTQHLPNEGIIIFHKSAFNENLKPNIKQLFVCIQADWGSHSFAQANISQNIKQTINRKKRFSSQCLSMDKIYFIHHWPQYNIIPRTPHRPLILQNISYFGSRDNLAPELQSEDWQAFVKEVGINWSIKDKHTQWNDYSSTDAVIFCRDFSGETHDHKPPTKVYNTWLAGCLPICTPESAFISEIKDKPEACLIVNSYEELKNKVIQLLDNKSKYLTLLNNSRTLHHLYAEEKITDEWLVVIEQLTKTLKQQQRKPISFYGFLTIRYGYHQIRKLMNKLLKK